jgi:hypothetical protein
MINSLAVRVLPDPAKPPKDALIKLFLALNLVAKFSIFIV